MGAMMHRLQHIATAAVATLLALALIQTSDARARSKADQHNSLIWYLSAYEVELTRTSLDRLGPDVPQLLVDILNTPTAHLRVRVRACAALAFYPSEQTFDVLRTLLHERSLKGNELGLQMRRQALRSLGRGFGDRGVDDILGLRNDPEPLVREAVAQALSDAGSARPLAMLETWLATEPVLHVRMAVDRAVSRLRGR
jgi:HEAT repeat protein